MTSKSIRLDAHAGEHIAKAARRLIDGAILGDGTATMKFNDVELVAHPTSTVGDIVARFNAECDRRSRAWRESPEGRQRAWEQERETERLQAECDRLVRVLPDLDFADLEAVIGWLCAFQPPSDHIDVRKPVRQVVDLFRSRGFEPGVNTDDEFRPDDRENVARYIVGQALDNLTRVGAIHQVLLHFAEQWRAKFREVTP